MGFSLGGFMSGAAGAVDSKMKSDRVEREAERSKVENVIYNTSSRLFENASLIDATRTKDRKKNNQYMTELLSSTGDALRNDTDKQAYILSLDDGAREDLLTLALRVQDPTFNPEGRSFADYLTAAEDPIEYKDATTLNEKVEAAVIPRPSDNKSYYGVSDTKDAEVDKIVASYNSVFAATYNMDADKARGLLDAAKQDVKVQSFNIDWAHKKDMLATEAARVTALVATAKLNTAEASKNSKRNMETDATKQIKKARDAFILGSGKPDEKTFNMDPNNQANFLASPEYAAVSRNIISNAVMYMESHPILKEPTMRFLQDNYPGQYGGAYNKGDPIEGLKDDVLYRAEFGNGPGLAKGSYLKSMIAAAGAEGKVGGKGKVDVEDQTIVSEKDSTYVNPTPSTTVGCYYGYVCTSGIPCCTIREEVYCCYLKGW